MSTRDERSSLLDPEGRPKRSPGLFHPDNAAFRFLVLIFICLLSFGSYYVYDNPGALQSYLQRQGAGVGCNTTTTPVHDHKNHTPTHITGQL